MKVTLSTLIWALLAAIVLSLAAWFWLVLHQFNLAHPWTELPDGLLHTFSYPILRPIAWKSLFFGFGTIGALLYALGDWEYSGERVLRGSRMVNGLELAKRTRISRKKHTTPVQVEVAGVPLPIECETGHLLLVGSTGTGKSTGIDELLSFALARGDRCIVVDPGGHAMSCFGKKGDVVLNPFDRRSPGWGLFNEVRNLYDYERLAKSVVSDAADTVNQQWHAYAQRLLADIRTKLLKDGHIDTVIGLPANLFFSTGIPVCILVLKKCKKPDDVLFINAAEHFEKGKRQNQLLPEHIDKIIDTYQYRKIEDRYSRRVSMDEIETNDFNLNISRYISTAEAEEDVDLGAVHAKLIDIEDKITKARNQHNAFLKELGLPLLP